MQRVLTGIDANRAGLRQRSLNSAFDSVVQIADSVPAFVSLPNALNGTFGQIVGCGGSDFSFNTEVSVQDGFHTGRINCLNQDTVGQRPLGSGT